MMDKAQHYLVDVEDRYDRDVRKFVKLYAYGEHDIRNQVAEMAGSWRVRRVLEYHEECGYVWAVHDTKIKGRALPFGCPSEAEARAAFGDR